MEEKTTTMDTNDKETETSSTLLNREETAESRIDMTDPFARRGSVGRTPPGSRKSSVSSTGEIHPSGLTKPKVDTERHDQQKGQATRDFKRKRVETPEELKKISHQQRLQNAEKDYFKLKELTRRILDETKTLKTVITEIPNTKKDIKCASHKLDRYAKEMHASIGFIDDILMALTEPKMEGRQTKEGAGTQTTDACTQTASKQQEEKENLIQKIENTLNKDLDQDELRALIETKWPEEVYKKCQINTDTRPNKEEDDVILILKEGRGRDNTLLQKYVKRNPQLVTMLENGQLKGGKMICSRTTNVIIADDYKSNDNMETYTYFVMTETGGETLEDRKELLDNIEKVIDIASKAGRRTTTCVVEKNINETKIRKIIEYTCRKKNTKITLSTTKMGKASEIGEENQYIKGETKRNRNEETILVKPTTGNSYADIIRSMKKEVTTEGILIERINRTYEGNIQIKIKGREEKCRQDFKELLVTKLNNKANIESKQRNQTLMILDIEETTQPEEAKEAVEREITKHGEKQRDVQIKMSEKANERGLKYAFLTVETDIAQKLLLRRKIGEGWNIWRIKELVTIPRCYKCHRVGHIANKCGKKNPSELCHKCGKPGHQRKDCQNEDRCYLCDADGHKAETMKCPEYRKLAEQQRKEKRVRIKV